ncbi:hypothetical protein [Fredinandcohnia onubensis]|uniref:hypothetical protein n=1 Tax=Fredinandcohnia onubensis TaxID=1571209 RepID=UPI000C0BB9B1|nr:hypothetical protein [Fredinandcohnia onubensis]
MAIRKVKKEDLHRLIDLIDENDNEPVYDLLQKVIDKKINFADGLVVEYDDSPLTEEEKKKVEKAEKEIQEGEFIDWGKLKNDL